MVGRYERVSSCLGCATAENDVSPAHHTQRRVGWMTGIATSIASVDIDTHGRATDKDRAARGFHSVERNWQAHDRRVPGALGDRLTRFTTSPIPAGRAGVPA